jgi:hypothetical protein
MATTEPRRRRTHLTRGVIAATVLAALSAIAGAASQVSAQEGLSQGCTTFNDPNFADMGSSEELGFPMPFHAGETITVSAGEPTDGGPPTVTELWLDIGPFGNPEVVDSGGFPATLHYTMPADGTHNVGFRVNAGQATWRPSCAAPLGTAGGGVVGADQGDLADTGGASGQLIAAAVLAVTVGGLALYVSRRRVA